MPIIVSSTPVREPRGRFAHDPREVLRGKKDIRESFIGGSFAPAKKGFLLSARQNAAKAPRSWPS